jgi:hypothetical protein
MEPPELRAPAAATGTADHRVAAARSAWVGSDLAADGSLTGYLGGLHRKQALLELAADGVASTLLKHGQQRRFWQKRQLAML